MQTRREVMRAIPVAAFAAAVPVMIGHATAEDDPIHAAIETHRQRQAELEEKPSRWATDKAFDAVCDEQARLSWALLKVEPTTVAGVVAMLAYVIDHDHGGFRDWPERTKRDDEPGPAWSSVPFEHDAIAWAVRHIERLTA